MTTLTNKRILLGVTGGIAAYKSAELVRRLKDRGAEVRVVMTAAAQEFITPLTMQALSGNPVHTDLLDTQAEAAMGHIELARWGDAVVIAPASADFIARLAHGEGSDLLATLCLATGANILLAPAMNQAMWANQATQANLALLKDRGIYQVGPGSGSQACGEVGPGRMSEPQEICTAAANLFETGALAGKKVVITAGPTREAIDPVRYISNHSSGKMGYALAQAAVEAGAQTVLISGPVNLTAPERVAVIRVESALEMHKAVQETLANTDIFIASAAVADYRPARVESAKIKKSAGEFHLSFVENPDIVADVAKAAKSEGIYVVGFAAETSELEAQAKDKLQRKGLDMIVANDVSNTRIGFNSENNAVTVVWRKGHGADDLHVLDIEERAKAQLARELIQLISKNLK